MPDFWKRLGGPLLLAALVLVAIVTLVSDRRAGPNLGRDLPWWQGFVLDAAAPVQALVAAPFRGAQRVWSRYLDLLDLRDDNDRLRDRVARLEEENLQYREALVVSNRLQQIAEMRAEYEVPILPSEIVGVDSSPFFRSVLIDRGRRQGVRGGQPVLTNQGLAGLITATAATAAKATLLLDRHNVVDGVVQRSRTRGLVRGGGGDALRFEFAVGEGDVREGDVLITSGLAGVYPKGLRIGSVVRLEDSGGRLMQGAAVRPAVDFGRLEQVFVMLRRGPTMALLYRDALPRELPAAGDADAVTPAP